MKLTSVWEGTLECIQYFTLAAATFIAGLLANRFGCRKVTLFALYLGALSSVVCAIVANFATLLLSRALIGLSVGLNVLHGVMIGKLGSNKAIIDDIVMISSMMFSLGAVWSSVLGYLLLEEMGWRTFVLVTSLPMFIPPIIILHCYIEEGTYSEPEEEREEIMKKEIQTFVPNYAARVTKLGLFAATSLFLGWMTTLLVPSLIRMFKIKEVGLT
jgi:MFS family permease